jgi:hypothetical protein
MIAKSLGYIESIRMKWAEKKKLPKQDYRFGNKKIFMKVKINKYLVSFYIFSCPLAT